MYLTIEDGLLSLLTPLCFTKDPTNFADIMYEHGLIPSEVRDDVHRLYKTGKLTEHHLKVKVLEAVNNFVSSNEKENVKRVVMLLEKYLYIEIGIYFMKDYLCKLLCVRGKEMGLIYNVYSTTSTNSTSISSLIIINFIFIFYLILVKNYLWSREVEMDMNNRIYIDDEDEMSVEDNEIPEEETNLTNNQQATESDDSRVQYPMDEESCRSIISMFILFIISLNDKSIRRDFFFINGSSKGVQMIPPIQSAE